MFEQWWLKTFDNIGNDQGLQTSFPTHEIGYKLGIKSSITSILIQSTTTHVHWH